MSQMCRILGIICFLVQLSCQIAFAGTHFTFEELNQNLINFIDSSKAPERGDLEFNWNSEVASLRKPVLESFNAGLASLFSDISPDTPIVEIGSGSSYSLPSDNVIRLQPNKNDLAGFVHSKGIFPITVQEFLTSISTAPEKKVPVYFALNVLDTIPAEERNNTLDAIAMSQSPGDKLLIASDLVPFLPTIVNEIATENPNVFVYPYIPIPVDREELTLHTRFSAVLIPQDLAKASDLKSINSYEFGDMIVSELQLRSKVSMGFQSFTKRSMTIAQLKKQHDLKLVVLEDYYANKMKNLLEKSYDVQVSYQTIFSRKKAGSWSEKCGLKQPILYKSVSDCEHSIRQWSCEDPVFLNRLAKRGISLPEGCTDKSIAADQDKLLGAEFLVIKAVRK